MVALSTCYNARCESLQDCVRTNLLNVQIDHQDNHTVRLTVDVDPNRLDLAMRQTARLIARKARIPGFRPGKAPYNVVVSMYGQEYVLAETMDKLGGEIYLETLEQAEIKPYAPGLLEDVVDDGQKLVFVVPKMPTADLGDYRSIRVEYEAPTVTDEMVDENMEELRQEQAVVEAVDRPARMGDQLRFSHLEVVALMDDDDDLDDDDEDDEDDDADDADEIDEAEAGASETEAESESDDDDEEEESDDDDDDEAEAESESDDEDEDEEEDDDSDDDDDEDWDDEDDGPNEMTLIHEHDLDRVLRDDDNDLFPGFSAELVDAKKGDTIIFSLELPDDFERSDLAGLTLRCEADVEQVSSRTVPEWSDALAQRVSNDEIATLLELRIDVRRRLQEHADNIARERISRMALDQLVEMADLHYPEEFVEDYINDIISEMDSNLRQRGFTLKQYLPLTGKTEEEFRAGYRDPAVERAERALVLRTLVEVEGITASDEDIDGQINEMVGMMGGEQSEQFRQYLNSDTTRGNIQSQLLTGRAIDILVAIAKGENPPRAEAPAAEAPAAEVSAAEASGTEESGESDEAPEAPESVGVAESGEVADTEDTAKPGEPEESEESAESGGAAESEDDGEPEA